MWEFANSILLRVAEHSHRVMLFKKDVSHYVFLIAWLQMGLLIKCQSCTSCRRSFCAVILGKASPMKKQVLDFVLLYDMQEVFYTSLSSKLNAKCVYLYSIYENILKYILHGGLQKTSAQYRFCSNEAYNIILFITLV